jgi:hypothetical protein
VYLHTSSYTQHATTLCQASDALGCQYEVQRLVPGAAQLCLVSKGQSTMTPHGWGKPAAIVASSPADLEPFLVDGHLKLKAVIRMVTTVMVTM